MVMLLLLTTGTTHTVETMLTKLKGDPNYDELIAPFRDAMEKQGKQVPESAPTGYATLGDKHLNRIKSLIKH